MYLYEICCSVSGGKVPENLANKHPRNMNHARWLATANSILRLYVATESLDVNLIIKITFISKMYADLWFRIKCRPQVESGPTHLFHMLNALRGMRLLIYGKKNQYFSVLPMNGNLKIL